MKRPRIRLSAFKQGGSPPSFAGAMAALEPPCAKIPTSRTPGPEARGDRCRREGTAEFMSCPVVSWSYGRSNKGRCGFRSK